MVQARRNDMQSAVGWFALHDHNECSDTGLHRLSRSQEHWHQNTLDLIELIFIELIPMQKKSDGLFSAIIG